MLRGTDIILLSDEVYEHLVFDGEPHASAINYPELRDRAFVIFSFGKVFHATGWKMGYALAPKALMASSGRCTSSMSSARTRRCNMRWRHT